MPWVTLLRRPAYSEDELWREGLKVLQKGRTKVGVPDKRPMEVHIVNVRVTDEGLEANAIKATPLWRTLAPVGFGYLMTLPFYPAKGSGPPTLWYGLGVGLLLLAFLLDRGATYWILKRPALKRLELLRAEHEVL